MLADSEKIVQGRDVTAATVEALNNISHELSDLSVEFEGTLREFGFKRAVAALPAARDDRDA